MEDELPFTTVRSTKNVALKISGFKLYIFLVLILFVLGVGAIIFVAKSGHANITQNTLGEKTSDEGLTNFVPVSGNKAPTPQQNGNYGPSAPTQTSTPTPKPTTKPTTKPSATAAPTPTPTQTPTPTSNPTTQPTSTPSPLTVTCTSTPTSQIVGYKVTWNSNVGGGSGGYEYIWTGSDGLSGTTASVLKEAGYETEGTKSATLKVTDSSSQTKEATCSIKINPA
jgi:hypothetical protein